ncbi:MAG: response regulator [Sneathiella sp.]|nr:response regulator [Sneathiella sp.]
MLKVLVAEDSVLVADMLEDFLTFKGYDVCGLARSVDEAVLLANRCEPDLAVLDFRLAGGGYGSQIRPLLNDKVDMGILYVSGDPLMDKLTKADGDAYIQKPYGLEDLCRALNIVRKIRANSTVFPATFPRSFRLLVSTAGEGENAA